ncbi:MAG: bacteriohemerythrin [Gammaproteobacteria bacterium]|nr:bacteriohemerythrin [Gammaproteobacteria bacterium]
MNEETIHWKDKYKLDIEIIDLQHQYFADLINRLSVQLNQTDNLQYQAALISELNAYARFHFISEENLMQQAGYPGLQQHKKLHHDLMDQLSVKESRLELNHGESEAESIIDFLRDWFLHHTVVEDRKFADYFHAQTQPAD